MDVNRGFWPSGAAAITVELENEKRERPVDDTGDEHIVRLETTFVPIGLTVFPADMYR